MDLFEKEKKKAARTPLADRMRPRNFKEFVGQEHILGPGKPLRIAIETDQVGSTIFWGPPGSGKTTVAYLIAAHSKAHFAPYSAVTSGVKEIKEVVAAAHIRRSQRGQKTILLIDEIHRFNKAQQDAFLPHVEKGTIVLVGATTENPSFEVVSPLLSRCRVYTLERLTEEQIELILEKALKDKERGLGNQSIKLEKDVLSTISHLSDGDGRVALSLLEFCVDTVSSDKDGAKSIRIKDVEEAVQKRFLVYDKAGEEHYNLISALHKSLRDSDPDGALYWLARMLSAGEDPLYLARRMIRFASEDIGNADPQALQVAVAAKDSYHFLGSPEGELALAQAAAYLATAPKSNAVYAAFSEATKDAREYGSLPVPFHIRNPVTSHMKAWGYGKDYKYAHDSPEAIVEQEHLPEKLKGRKYYRPHERGFEREIKKRLEYWGKLKAQRRTPTGKKATPKRKTK
ncbi:MAG: AAA family ATPase [candidate division Zixibacteria bacterium DG_27]|nr:MAG: AAA family ATPase [candidate division Zixibacteria bacterium DG_27]